MSRTRSGVGRAEHRLLELVDPVLELLDFGPVAIDHPIDDAMEERDRAFAQDLVVARAVIAELLDRSRVAVVHRDEVVRAEKEVDVVRGEVLALGGSRCPCRTT